MRNLFRTLGVLLGGAIGVAVLALPASATFTTPSSNPFAVPGDGSGNPLPFDVVVSGFTGTPRPNVFEEICDGTPATAQGWDPTVNCDSGTSGASATPDANGVVSFPASNLNLQDHPFKGPSPSNTFNCIAPGESDPGNGLPTFSNCQLRVATNNNAVTSDQQFITLTLPTSGGPATPEVPYAVILPLGAIAVGGGYFLIRRRRAANASA